MRIRGGFLRTVVGRRLVVLFLVAALLPVGTMAALAYTHVKRELRRQAELRVSRNAKIAGLNTLASLSSLHHVFSQVVVPSVDTRTRSDLAVPVGFTNVESRALPDSVPDFGADGGANRALTDDERARLGRGETLIAVASGSGAPSILMARRAVRGRNSGGIVWAKLSESAIWDATSEALQGEGHTLCVLEARRIDVAQGADRALRCPLPPPDDARGRLSERRGRGDLKLVEWTDGDRRYYSAGWNIFLQFQFGSPDWRVIVSEDASDVYAPLDRFMVTFALVSVLAMCTVLFLSHLQIRKSTEPLEKLSDGTRRIAAGDFTTPVTVRSRDEFEELATSFNGMARSLDRQLTSLRNLDALHQAVLGARELRPLVETAAARFGTLMPGSAVAIAIHGEDGFDITAARGSIVMGSEERVRLSASELDELRAQPRQLVLPGGAVRSYVAGAFQGEYPDVFVLPLWREEKLLGIVTVGAAGIDRFDDDQRAAARRLADRLALGLADVQHVRDLDALSSGTLTAFARTIDAVSPWTAGHSERVTALALAIGERMSLSTAEMTTLKRGGLLHDIGKIGVPASIVDKAGPLSEKEREVMERHPVLGAIILEPIRTFVDALPIVRSHHERMDGRGYPDGLRGEEIHILARVLAVADVFDALVSHRPYRAGLPVAAAVAMVTGESGTHFDERAVRAFLLAVNEGVVLPILSERTAAASVADAVVAGRTALGEAA
jgi:putative nucleotidyltransferase with HDIG domain